MSSDRPCALYVQYTNPAGYPPLQRSARLLANEGWSVRFLGLEGWGAHELRFPDHERITVRRMSTRASGWRQKLNYLRYAIWCLSEIASWKPDWIYISDPLATPIGVLSTFLFDTPVLYHEHDSPSEDSPDSWFMRAVLASRRVLARRADLCVLPNEDRAALLRQQTGRTGPIHCVWNCPARGELPERRNVDNGLIDDKPFYLHYHGSIAPARLPVAIVEALTALPSFVHLRVFGYESEGRNHQGTLQARAEEMGVADRVEIHGPTQHAELLDWAQRADLGLSFMPMKTDDINLRYMVGASNKPFEYLACGLPILVSDLPAWKEMYVEPEYGRACNPNDFEDIAETIWSLVQDRESLREMGQEGRKKIEKEWNYNNEFYNVIKKMNKK